VFDRIAALYATRYGVADAELPSVADVEIEGVTDVAGYAGTIAYLQGLSPVRRVDLLGAAGDVLRLRLTFRGDAAALERLIGLDDALGRSLEPPSPGALRFRLTASAAPMPPPAPSDAPATDAEPQG